MSDVDRSGDPPVGGPSWMRRGPADAPPAPSVPAPPTPAPWSTAPAPGAPGAPWSAPDGAPLTGPEHPVSIATPAAVNTGPLGGELEMVRPPQLDHSRHATSPLPHAAVALSSIVALVAANLWATAGRPDLSSDSLATVNDIWTTVSDILLARLDIDVISSTFRGIVLLIVAGIAVLSVVTWVSRLGRNLPPSGASFGAGFALLALPAWWTFPLNIGISTDTGLDRFDVLTRAVLAAIILVVQFLLLRWALLNKVWRAGRIPADPGAIVLWLPELIPWGMLLGSTIYTIAGSDPGEPPPSGWYPTVAMLQWGRALSAVSLVGILALFVAVSIRQHVGIQVDRRRDDEARRAHRLANPQPELRLP